MRSGSCAPVILPYALPTDGNPASAIASSRSSYAWSVSGGVLTLDASAGGDACKQRGAVLAGDWTRVG